MKRIKTIRLHNASQILHDKLLEKLGADYVWLPEYDKIADWLTDNNGKGLLLIGGQGLGKTLICDEIFKEIFNEHLGLNYDCYNPFDIGERRRELMKDNCPSYIDDIGLEGAYNDHGNITEPFVLAVYFAERNGRLLVGTTNMTPNEMLERYKIRILDRIRAIMTVIVFSQEHSLRNG